MKPEEIQNFESDQNHPIRVALQHNDLWDWKRESPVYIFHGLGDELVPYENAQIFGRRGRDNSATISGIEQMSCCFHEAQRCSNFCEE